MSIQYNPLDNAGSGATAYRNLRWEIIRKTEGFEGGVLYYDSNGNLSIGFGFKLKDSIALQNQVMMAMGLDPNAAVGTAENGYIAQIRNLINANSTGTSGKATSLQAAINTVMATRAADAAIPGANKKSTFVFSTTDAARSVFEFIAENPFGAPSYESRVDTWLSGIPYSKERAVLFSLSYNAVLNGSNSLLAALQGSTDNRPAAWFQIRYQSNGDKLPGIAKRRYYESQVFGLYKDQNAVSATEAASVIAYLNAPFSGGQTHLQYMLGYEKKWNQEAAAVGDYSLAGTAYNNLFFQTVFKPIASYLFDHYKDTASSLSGNSFTFDGQVVLGLTDSTGVVAPASGLNVAGLGKNDLLIGLKDGYQNLDGKDGNDVLIGGSGNDFLWGGTGNDVLMGKQGDDYLFGEVGDDTLIGGVGNDKYDFKSGDGNDTLIDSQGKDSLYIDGNLITHAYHEAGDDANTFHFWDTNGTIFTFTKGTDLVITRSDTADKITLKNYDINSKTLGIDLDDEQLLAYNGADFADLFLKYLSDSAQGVAAFAAPPAYADALIVDYQTPTTTPQDIRNANPNRKLVLFTMGITDISAFINADDGGAENNVLLAA